MKQLLLLLAISIGIYSCGNKPEQGKETHVTASDSAESYLPIRDLLKGEVRNVDSFSTAILRKADFNGRKDSTFVKLPYFHELTQQFFMQELDSIFFRENYTEASFMDETTQMLNFIYTAKDSTLALRKAVVYVKPTLQNDNMDRLYFETVQTQGDTTIEKRLTWKIRKYFYILTTKQPKNGQAITTMEKLIWDPQYFAEE